MKSKKKSAQLDREIAEALGVAPGITRYGEIFE